MKKLVLFLLILNAALSQIPGQQLPAEVKGVLDNLNIQQNLRDLPSRYLAENVYRKSKTKELALLAPSSESQKKFADVLSEKNTGLIRLADISNI